MLMSFLTKAQEKVLKRQVLKYAKETKNKDLCKKITENADELVAWYATNNRELTLPEFRKIIGEK